MLMPAGKKWSEVETAKHQDAKGGTKKDWVKKDRLQNHRWEAIYPTPPMDYFRIETRTEGKKEEEIH